MKEERLDIRLLQAHFRLVGNPGASAIITKALGRSEKGGDSFSETEVSLSLRCLATEWISTNTHSFVQICLGFGTRIRAEPAAHMNQDIGA